MTELRAKFGITRADIKVRANEAYTAAVVEWPYDDETPALTQMRGDIDGFVRLLLCLGNPMLPMGATCARCYP